MTVAAEAETAQAGHRYPRVSLYALMLASAGIPLYIHLPRFASVHLEVGLATIGTLLLAIRLVDLVQDPALGWAIDRWPQAQPLFAMIAAAGLAAGFPLLFLLEPGGAVLWQLLAVLVLLFSAYSLGMILLYGRSATLARSSDPRDLVTLAAWREAGMLGGVVLAAMAPALLASEGDGTSGYGAYGVLLGSVACLVAILTLPMWRRPVLPGAALSLAGLRKAGAMRLLALALVNSLPVAITSTLFLFFVEDRLMLPGLAGPFLVLFFVCAGLSVPAWAWLVNRIGARTVLLVAMPLAILGFVGAGFLGPGNSVAFAVICVISGAALGADMVVLPAMFSIALTRAGLNASAAFGIWSFAGKLGLALAAFLVLPALQASGFAPGEDNTPDAIGALTIAYAFVPCILKLLAMGFVLALPTEDTTQ
ncbi:Na+/melibiose symporter-like transporter [Aliiruegeria haliotis]|uniref:Na+/melibiose symporter-like transporter n=1 Tax=Aliiruegeria haliotis TaxID=1280846 RepID=A0A2T0RN54_9RHOB|nr:MFS transporter [Aliiruegeria haliotis]PRY22543.1 Na+/melibiose symporter-like transporter [Aliiruegeria haliotis]